jgi:hypothetical protein
MITYVEFYFDASIYFHWALLGTETIILLYNFPNGRYCRLCVLRIAHNYAMFFVVGTVSVYSEVGTLCLILLYKIRGSNPEYVRLQIN